MYKPESDAAPWSFFNVDQILDYVSIDKDEIIARALFQKELSLLSISESPELSHSGEEYSQNSSVVPNCYDSSDNYFLGHEAGPSENVDVGSTCSSPGDRSCDDGDSSYNLEIADEFEIDGEVEKRLYQMFPVPHVPRINGEIPSVDEVTSDHQRLLDRLKLHDLIEHKVQGDGNCQFRALSDQFYRTPEHHKFVRQQVVCQLKANPEMYEGYVPMDYAEYLKRISESGEWGDHVTLQAAADSYGVRILVVTSFKDTCYIEILPQHQKSKRVVYLSFWAEVHYNSIYPQGDLPRGDFKRKKKWWNFLNQH